MLLIKLSQVNFMPLLYSFKSTSAKFLKFEVNGNISQLLKFQLIKIKEENLKKI